MFRNWILKTTDFLAGPVACALIGSWLTLLDKSKAPQNWKPENTKRILIIRPGGIGDMILLLPFISALSKHFPSAGIDIVCERRNMAVIQLSGISATCIPYDANPVRLVHRLIQAKYDIAVDSEQFHHFSAVFAAISSAPVRIGFNINPRRNGLYTHLIPYSPDSFEADEFLKLLKPLGITSDNKFSPAPSTFAPPPGTVLEPETLSRLIDMKAGTKLAVLHAGGSMQRKLWPENEMRNLIRTFADRENVSVVILGSSADSSRCRSVYADFRNNPNVMCLSGDLDLAQCAALIALADIFIGPDSGLMHLAVSMDKPTIAVFGPSNRRKWGFANAKHRVVCNDLPCSPCCIFGYSKPCRHYQCIEDISAELVLQEFLQLKASL